MIFLINVAIILVAIVLIIVVQLDDTGYFGAKITDSARDRYPRAATKRAGRDWMKGPRGAEGTDKEVTGK